MKIFLITRRIAISCISFFTFQAAGYLVDVYQGKYKAETNFVNFALFVSFFPQLLSGPIGRDTAEVLAELGYTQEQIKAMYEAQEVK